MPPDPSALRLLATFSALVAQLAEFDQSLTRHICRSTTQAEGGETMERRAREIGGAASACREAAQSFALLADRIESEGVHASSR